MKRLVAETLNEYLIPDETELFKGQVKTGLTIDDVDEKEFLVGLAIEKKHSTNLAVQRELVFQNLAKNPKYYSEGMKDGLFNDVEAINLYKKYFIDKEEIKESLNESLKDELINNLLTTVYADKDPEETRKELELKSEEQLDQELSDYYLFDIKK